MYLQHLRATKTNNQTKPTQEGIIQNQVYFGHSFV